MYLKTLRVLVLFSTWLVESHDYMSIEAMAPDCAALQEH